MQRGHLFHHESTKVRKHEKRMVGKRAADGTSLLESSNSLGNRSTYSASAPIIRALRSSSTIDTDSDVSWGRLRRHEMIDTPQIFESRQQIAAVIRFKIPRSEIR